MLCFVYASHRKGGSYLWLAKRDDFSTLPASLSAMLGELRFVLEVELDEQRKLPVEDADQVRAHLQSQRWHLQVPPAETLAGANQLAYNLAPSEPKSR